MSRVPARYVGAHSVTLPAANGPYEDADGKRLESTRLEPGDTLKIYEHEAWGQTLKWDPAGNAPLLLLGWGRVLLDEHAHPVEVVNAETGETRPRKPYTEAELSALGYEFQPARVSQFEALLPPPDPDHEALAELGLRAVQTAGISVAPPTTASDALSVASGRGKSRAPVPAPPTDSSPTPAPDAPAPDVTSAS